MRNVGARLATAAMLLAAAVGVRAQEGDGTQRGTGEVSLWLGHVASDNLARTSAHQRGSYNTLGANLSMAHTTTRFDGELSADLEYRKYSDENLEDETVGNLYGTAILGIVPDRFEWLFHEVYTQAQTDIFAPVGPQNREAMNMFATGPSVYLPLGRRTELELESILAKREYGLSTELDSEDLTSSIGVTRRVNQTTNLGIVASHTRTEYDGGVLPYEIDSISLTYGKTLSSGGVNIVAGQNELEISGVTTDGPLFDFSWRRDLTVRSTLQIAAARELTDSGALFDVYVEDPVLGQSQVVLGSNPLEQRRISASYSLQLQRADFSVGVAHTEDSFVGDRSFDNEADTGFVELGRDMTARLYLSFRFEEALRDLPEAGEDYRDTATILSLDRQFNGRLSLYANVARYERRGTDELTEDRYEIRLVYSPTR